MSGDTFSAWLRRQLQRREWTESDLARRMSTTPSVVNRWARGERVPSPQSCESLADVLLIDVNEVLERAGHKPREIELPPGDPRRTIIALIRQLDPDDPVTRFWLESLPPTIEQLRKLDKERGAR